jgi:hypothetical protein
LITGQNGVLPQRVNVFWRCNDNIIPASIETTVSWIAIAYDGPVMMLAIFMPTSILQVCNAGRKEKMDERENAIIYDTGRVASG